MVKLNGISIRVTDNRKYCLNDIFKAANKPNGKSIRTWLTQFKVLSLVKDDLVIEHNGKGAHDWLLYLSADLARGYAEYCGISLEVTNE